MYITCKSWWAVTYKAGWPLNAAPPILTGRGVTELAVATELSLVVVLAPTAELIGHVLNIKTLSYKNKSKLIRI